MKPIAVEQGKFYHIYNRGNNSQDIFFENKNYEYFLGLMDKYVIPVADVYAWVLMKNHFHLLIYTKSDEEIDVSKLSYSTVNKPKKLTVSKQFSNLFSAYTLAINKMYKRTGSLFQKNFKRILVSDEKYLLNLIYYIHQNPVKHGFVESSLDYPWSSYISVLSNKPTKIQREKILSLFDDKNKFREYQAAKQDLDGISRLIGE